MKLTKAEADILLHRLEVPDAIAESFTDKMDGDEPCEWTYDQVRACAESLEQSVRSTMSLPEVCPDNLTREVLYNCLDASTYIPSMDEGIGDGFDSPQKIRAYIKVAKAL